MKKPPKKNFVKNVKYNFKKNEGFKTVFHISISSKAMFGLTDGALKLYMMFILNGKKNIPSIKTFAKRIGKSERTVSRLYQELKEKGFLKIHCVSPKVYQYTFDYNGNIGYKKNIIKPGEVLEEYTETSEETFKEVEEILNNKDIELLDKAKTIMEYEDFAVMENIYWTLSQELRNQILNIMENRIKVEPESEQVLTWFIEKVKYV
ncbi:helix-turn-helix domain-containing protein [bacterium]|nr:helix-turn-helix domain-containing protein [bacterium]